jgi:hypothetical protein
MLDVPGVHEQQLELVLEQVVDALPVDAGRFHRHVCDLMRAQPIAQGEQIRGRRPECLDQLAHRPVDHQSHARRQARLVHIQPAAAGDHRLHPAPPSQLVARNGARERLRVSMILLCVLKGDSSGCQPASASN